MTLIPGDRVHIINGSPQWLDDPNAVRWIACCITGDQYADCYVEMAALYDIVFGGDDRMVGLDMTNLARLFAHDRDHAERTLLAVDVLRRSRRTMH